jgi:hypothetical protein
MPGDSSNRHDGDLLACDWIDQAERVICLVRHQQKWWGGLPECPPCPKNSAS